MNSATTEDLLRSRGYLYHFGLMAFVHKGDKKLFSVEAVEKMPLGWVEERMSPSCAAGGWQLFYTEPGPAFARAQVLEKLGEPPEDIPERPEPPRNIRDAEWTETVDRNFETTGLIVRRFTKISVRAENDDDGIRVSMTLPFSLLAENSEADIEAALVTQAKCAVARLKEGFR